jgi:structural maintenance of chromosome 1
MTQTEQQLVREQAAARRVQQRRDEIDTELEAIHGKLRQAKDDRSKNREDEKLVHAISVLKRHFKGVHGRLVDLCRPVSRKYSLAVQTAAGKDMDAVVVDTQQTAFECIRYLRDQRIGSITCLPLDRLQVPSRESTERLASQIAQDSRYRLAVDVIQATDPAFQRAVQYAVGNSVVCDDLDAARELCFGHRRGRIAAGAPSSSSAVAPRVKAVTLQGTVISKTGTMTGGLTQGDDSKAGRWDDAELVKLRDRKDKLEAERLELESSVDAGGTASLASPSGRASRSAVTSHAQQIEELKNRLGSLRNRNQFAKADLDFHRKQLVDKQSLLHSTEHQVAKLEKQAKAAEKEFEKAKAAVEKARDEIKAAEDSIFGPFREATGVQDLQAYGEAIGKSRDEYNDKKRTMTEHMAQLEQQINYEKGRDLELPIARIEKRMAERRAAKIKAEERHAKLEKELSEAQENLRKAEEAVAEAESAEKDKEAEVDQVQKELNRVQKERGELRKKISALDAHLERHRGQLHETLQKARVEEVELPLVEEEGDGGAAALQGSRADGSARRSRTSRRSGEDDGTSSEEEESQPVSGTQGPTQFSQADNPVVVHDQNVASKLDFSGLRPSLKEKLSDREEKSLRKEFEDKLSKLQDEISSMNPNMKVQTPQLGTLIRFALIS